MHIENPKLEEAKNPNVSHESATREISVLLIQLAALVVLLLALARAFAWALGNYLPYSYEQKWLAPIGSAMVKDSVHDAKLQTLADQLKVHVPLPEGAQIQVHTLPEPDINAFATFGGHIVFMQGLLEHAPSEQAISMVLAHEMAHVGHRDPLKASSQSAMLQILRSAVFGEQVAVDSGLMLSMLSYSRGQETAADEAALDAIHAHYGSIAGAIEMYDFLGQQRTASSIKNWLPQWLSTHPDTQKRQEHLRAYAQQKGYSTQGSVHVNPWRKIEP